MPHPLTIVVGGYIVGYPLGGMTWHHLNYLLGLHALGHEVWFLEDSGEFALPYNPKTHACEPDSTFGRAYLEHTFGRHGLPLRYCYYSHFEDRHYGMTRDELHALLARADLLVCVSGVTPLRPDRPRPKRTLAIDTDPVYTQLRMAHDEPFASYWRSFDHVATFGRLIGTIDCPLPAHGLQWIATNQPVALEHWPFVEPVASVRFTTVGKWEHAASRAVEFRGQRLRSSKAPEWMKLIDLPARTRAPLTLAMESMQGPVRGQFELRGWQLADAEAATRTTESFREFVAGSAGEFTVAKEIYAAVSSGWFSDRSACYLATGRPVVTQSTGFEKWLPVGEGLMSFTSVDEAAAALDRVCADPPRHARAARAIAERHFDARRVLGELLDAVI
jgi:hypothetical protein